MSLRDTFAFFGLCYTSKEKDQLAAIKEWTQQPYGERTPYSRLLRMGIADSPFLRANTKDKEEKDR
jgi:hypothetical protein